VLLDALGTKAGTKEDLKQKVSNFDLIDDRLNSDIMILSQKLQSNGYDHLIYSGTIYDFLTNKYQPPSIRGYDWEK
jgi:hypothetical protein